MKTTIDLPDALVRAIKIRAVEEDKSLKDLVAELLDSALKERAQAASEPHYVTLPLIRATRKVPHVPDLTPEELKQILIDEDVERALRA